MYTQHSNGTTIYGVWLFPVFFLPCMYVITSDVYEPRHGSVWLELIKKKLGLARLATFLKKLSFWKMPKTSLKSIMKHPVFHLNHRA